MFRFLKPVPFALYFGDSQICQPQRRARSSFWQDVQRLLVDFQSMVKLPLLLQLVAQVSQTARANIGTISIANGLLQCLVSGWTVFEADGNSQTHRAHVAHVD